MRNLVKVLESRTLVWNFKRGAHYQISITE